MNDQRKAPRAERGSAFILALIVILLLTVLGMSLSVVTETEMQLGATEKTIERQEYAAETGMWVKVAQLLVANDWKNARLALLEEPDTGTPLPNFKLGYAIESTAAISLAEGCPPLTDCGEDLDSQQFLSFFVLLGATAKRVGFPDAKSSPFDGAGIDRWAFASGIEELGQASVSMGFFVSPLRHDLGSVSALDATQPGANSGFRSNAGP
ncbi:MAG: hypothetical protein D6696_08105 [Acidobacteria bacterium]|nr:MAG: hypothetical protein D6696_08105 [Acidobacteriota bacterium]